MNSSSPAFQWSAGAWYGSLIGCTTWLGLLSFGIASRDGLTALVLFGMFGLIWVDALRLWKGRAGRDPLRSLQRMCAVAFVASTAGIAVAYGRGAMPGNQALPLALSLLIYPALIGLFEFRQRASLRDLSPRP